MEFSKSQELQAIESLAAQVFEDTVTDPYLADAPLGDNGYDESLWATLADTGLLGCAIDSDYGGSGLGASELCAVAEAQGRVLAPVPLLASLFYAAAPIARFGDSAQQQRWLAPLAGGETHMTGALEHAMRDEWPVRAQVSQARVTLEGVCAAVPYAAGAAGIVVPAQTHAGIVVAVVAADTQGVSIERQYSSAGQPWHRVALDNVELSHDDVIGKAGEGAAIVAWMLQYAVTGVAAAQLGVVDTALRRTAAYTMERKQFGRPVASFQAVSHRAADGYIDREALRLTVLNAAWRLDADRDARLAARSAKWWACEAGHRIGHTTQHLHGGIGADVAYPIHRYFLAAKQLENTLGGARLQLGAQADALAAQPELGVSV